MNTGLLQGVCGGTGGDKCIVDTRNSGLTG